MTEDVYIPFLTEEYGIVYSKNPKLNTFGGLDIRDMQILKSAAGYYIGDLINETFDLDDGTGKSVTMWTPYSRDSQDYWEDRKQAEEALITGKYRVKF